MSRWCWRSSSLEPRAAMATWAWLGMACASACSQPTEVVVPHFVGELEGKDVPDVKVAVVLGPDRATAYLCGRGTALDSHTRWFFGPAADDTFELVAGDWTLTGWQEGDRLAGELTGTGAQRWTFSARALPVDTSFGLFEARVGSCRAGAIVWPGSADDGCEVRGAVCEDGGPGLNAQVTPVDCPVDASLRGTATRAGTTVTFDLERLADPIAPEP